MKIEGKLAKWNDDRGFGFILPTNGGQEIFAHISAFPASGDRPKLGELVSFEIEIDQSGKKRAIAISYSSRSNQPRNTKYKPERSYRKRSLASRLMPVFLIGLLVYGYSQYSQETDGSLEPQDPSQNLAENLPHTSAHEILNIQENSSDAALSEAYKNQTSSLQIAGEGNVTTILSDDNDGSRHQKFILRLSSGQTLLIAHNIDLAQRIDSLADGDSVKFYGQYEWNERGGVIHWTHNDPSGNHVAGWLEHKGKRYQ